MKRNRSVDVIKGVCIIFIIITHYAWTDAERLRFLFPFWIDMAVPVFMIISGYVYTFSYIRNKIENISDAYRVKFVSDKIIRYTIPYSIAWILEVSAYKIFSDINFGGVFVRRIWPRKLLFPCHDSVYICISRCILCY